MKRTAEVHRDAKIGEAEANKDSGIKVIPDWPVNWLWLLLIGCHLQCVSNMHGGSGLGV